MNKLIELMKSNLLYLIGAFLGAIGGYLYWFYIGCSNGTCPITASPVISSIWGAVTGSLLLSMFKQKKVDE